MAKKAKLIEAYTGRGLAIIGPHGNIWGHNLFRDKDAAMRHLKEYWRGVDGFDPSRWRVIQASAVVRADAEAKPERICN